MIWRAGDGSSQPPASKVPQTLKGTDNRKEDLEDRLPNNEHPSEIGGREGALTHPAFCQRPV